MQKSASLEIYVVQFLFFLLCFSPFLLCYSYVQKYDQKVTMNAQTQNISFGKKKYQLDDIKEVFLKSKRANDFQSNIYVVGSLSDKVL